EGRGFSIKLALTARAVYGTVPSRTPWKPRVEPTGARRPEGVEPLEPRRVPPGVAEMASCPLAARGGNPASPQVEPIPPGVAEMAARGAGNRPLPGVGTSRAEQVPRGCPPAAPRGAGEGAGEAPPGQRGRRGEAPGNGISRTAHRARRSAADSGSVPEIQRASCAPSAAPSLTDTNPRFPLSRTARRRTFRRRISPVRRSTLSTLISRVTP